jgi:hypothetical protein
MLNISRFVRMAVFIVSNGRIFSFAAFATLVKSALAEKLVQRWSWFHCSLFWLATSDLTNRAALSSIIMRGARDKKICKSLSATLGGWIFFTFDKPSDARPFCNASKIIYAPFNDNILKEAPLRTSLCVHWEWAVALCKTIIFSQQRRRLRSQLGDRATPCMWWNELKYAQYIYNAGWAQTNTLSNARTPTFAGAIMDDALIACIVMAVAAALDFFILARGNNLCVCDVTVLAVGKRCRSNANSGAMRVWIMWVMRIFIRSSTRLS